MNKRKQINLLKAENRLAYKTLDAYLDQLVAVEKALHPDQPLITMSCSNTVQQVTELVHENKRLQAEIDIMTGKSIPRPAPCKRQCESTAFEIEIARLEAEKEILLAQARKDRHALSIGRAINRAAELLPDKMSITIDVERDSGTVDLFIRGRLVSEEFHGDDLGEEINAAIDYAIAVAQEQEPQA